MKQRGFDDDEMRLSNFLVAWANDAYEAGDRDLCIQLIDQIYTLHSDFEPRGRGRRLLSAVRHKWRKLFMI